MKGKLRAEVLVLSALLTTMGVAPVLGDTTIPEVYEGVKLATPSNAVPNERDINGTEVVNFILYMNDGTDTKFEEGEQIKGQWVTLTNRIPSRDGYKFVGWSSNPEGTDVFFDEVYLSEDTELYAKWEKKDERYVEVTYHLNDGTGGIYKKEEILKGGLPNIYGLPSNGNFIHKGWYLEPECINEFLAYKYTDGVTSDIHLYAGWDEKKIITVTYHLNDGSVDDVHKIDERHTEEWQPNMPLPTRKNYKFLGWFTEPECINKVTGNIRLTESQDLYAGWTADGEKPDKIIVTYDMSYDMVFSIFKVDEIDKGGRIDLSEKPKVLGRDFIGWYKDKGFTEQVDETTVLIEDTYLYAKYRKEYMIKFYMNDGTKDLYKTDYIPEGESLVAHGQPEREGYTFTGWYMEPECKIKVDSIDKDGALYAGWKKKENNNNSSDNNTNNGNNNNSSDNNTNNGNSNSNGNNNGSNGNSNSNGNSSFEGGSSLTETIDYDWYLDTDERWYFLPKNKWGILSEGKRGWYYEQMDSKWYYFDLTDGHMLTGWNFIDERWYFFTEVNGGQTYFGDNTKGWKYTPVNEIRPYGSMYVNEITPDGYSVDENGALK